MDKSVVTISLKKLCKKDLDSITMEKLISVVGSESGNDIINALFLFANETLDDYLGKEELGYLVNGLSMISATLECNKDINRKSIKKKLRKLFEKVDRILEERKNTFADKKRAIVELEKVTNELNYLEQNTATKENKQYKFLKFIIKDTKNITYLEQTFQHLPNSVNLVDKEGNSLFSNVINEYLDKIKDSESSKEELLYYNNVILLMKSQKNFELKSKDRSNCLQNIKNSIMRIRSEEKDCKLKQELLTNMKDLIINDDVPNFDIDRLTSDYNINIGFNNTLIDELSLYQTSVSREKYPDRVIVDDYVITIDGAGAVELDDALTAKKLDNGNYLLGGHIANVLGYLPYNSSIIREAISRSSSIYLPTCITSDTDYGYSKVIPMLPFQFSAEDASLLENKYRLATSFFMELDKDGNVVNQKYFKTIIRNNKKCTYDEINSAIEFGSPIPQINEMVKVLDEITYKLEEKNKPTEIYTDIKEKTIDPSNNKVGNSRAEKIINQTMKLINSKIADFFAHSTEGYPFLYRVHEIDDESIKKLEEEMTNLSNVYDKEKFDKLYQILIGVYPKARYDTAGGHDGLNLKHYCHGTSPLRRAADIVVEHALDVCYFNNPSDKELSKLENSIEENKNIINAKNNDIEYFLTDYYRQKRKIRKR